jgi:hypothetical protein
MFIYCNNGSNATMQEVMFFNSVASGWNTWDNKNMLSHVLLPAAFSLTVGYADITTKQYINNGMYKLKTTKKLFINKLIIFNINFY